MHEASVYKPKSERYRKTVALATSLGLAATVGALAHPNRASASSNQVEAVACTPVLKVGEKPQKLVAPKGNRFVSKQQEFEIETAYEAYRRSNEVANAIINFPLNKKALSHFKNGPFDKASSATANIGFFKNLAGQQTTPNSDLYYQASYPICVNVYGENWLGIDTTRVYPQHSNGPISPRSETDWRMIWSDYIWIKPSVIDQIPGVKMYAYNGVSHTNIIKGQYVKSSGPPIPGAGEPIYFKNIDNDVYDSVSAAPKAAVNNIYKSAKQIHNLDQYLGGR